MKYTFSFFIIFVHSSTIFAFENADAMLLRSCYNLDMETVVVALRSDANPSVSVKSGYSVEGKNRLEEAPLLHDPWDNGLPPIGSGDWTPLMVTAYAQNTPPPPADFDPSLPAHRVFRNLVSKNAIRNRSKRAVFISRILLSHGVDVNHADKYGVTALYICVERGNKRVAKILLKFGADPNVSVSTRIDSIGQETPLHVCKSASMARLLLTHGANPLAKNAEGDTAADSINRSQEHFRIHETAYGWRVEEVVGLSPDHRLLEKN